MFDKLKKKDIIIEVWEDDDRSHRMWKCPTCGDFGFYDDVKPLKKCPRCKQRLNEKNI